MNKWIFAVAMALCVGCSSNSSDSPEAEEQNKPSADASGSSDSGGSDLDGMDADEDNRLAVSGLDTDAFNGELAFDYFAFRENSNGGEFFLMATSDSLVLDLLLADLGEFSEDDISVAGLSDDRVTLNAWPNGLVLRLESDGQYWQYSQVCEADSEVAPCDSFHINEQTQTLTLTAAELQPTPGDDNSATAPIHLSGILKWLESDTVVSGKPINNNPPVGAGPPATLADIQGVWDASMPFFGEEDEFYVVFDGNTYVEYDYDGDSAGGGDNCYYVETGEIKDLGDGRFNTIDSMGEEDVVSIYIDGKNLNLLFLTLKPVARHPSDFVPEC